MLYPLGRKLTTTKNFITTKVLINYLFIFIPLRRERLVNVNKYFFTLIFWSLIVQNLYPIWQECVKNNLETLIHIPNNP